MHAHGSAPSLDLLLLGVAAVAIAAYVGGVVSSRRRGRAWPWYRSAFWCVGALAATASVLPSVAVTSHDDFVMHMATHLLGGMIAPLLLVLAAPVTLALRTLAVTPARRVSWMLRSAPARMVSHPITAAVISVGGLWLIYLTPVLGAMRSDPLVHVVVQAHVLAAGCLFTAAIIGTDPHPAAPSRVLVACVLVASVAAHGVLAKYLYAYPPRGVGLAQAESGAQVMYYGGAVIEAVVIVIFCAQWYRAAGRRMLSTTRRAAHAAPRLRS